MSTRRFVVLILGIFITLSGCSSEEDRSTAEGSQYLELHQYDKAVEAYSNAITLNPNFEPAYLGRCRAQLALNDFEAASKDLASAIAHRGDSWVDSYYSLIGNEFLKAGRYDDAIDALTVAVEIGIEYSTSYTLNSDPKPGAKAQWYRQLSGYYATLGRAQAMAGKCEEAVQQFETALKAGGASRNRVDFVDNLVALAFSDESGERKIFAKQVGAYFYNLSVLEKKLGRPSDETRGFAEKLGYNERDILLDIPECDQK